MQITVNETGARTLKDARPMMINDHKVYVVVDGGTASLFVGGRIVAERAADDMNTADAQAWAVEYRESLAAPVATDETVTPAVAQVCRAAAQLIERAKSEEVHGAGPYTYRNANGKPRTFTVDDPRHPMQAAKSYRADAEILGAWTAEDESGYGQYVSDGIGDTDGYFAPVDRAQWKRFLAA